MGRVVWTIKARGGPFDGWAGETDEKPRGILILWACQGGCEYQSVAECQAHGAFDALYEKIVLATAEPYRRVELDTAGLVAVYEPAGTPDPALDAEVEEPDLVGAGAGPGYGEGLWP